MPGTQPLSQSLRVSSRASWASETVGLHTPAQQLDVTVEIELSLEPGLSLVWSKPSTSLGYGGSRLVVMSEYLSGSPVGIG